MEAVDVWVQLIQDGKEHLEPVPIEVHLSCTIHDLKGQVMRKFAGDLPTSAAEQHLTVSQSKSSQDEGQRLKPLASMESELARLAISSTSPLVLFVHVPPKEDLQVELARLQEIRLTEEAKAEEAKAHAEKAKAQAQADAEKAKAQAQADAEKVKAQALATAEEEQTKRLLIEARCKGIRGVSLTPSELCQAMEKEGNDIDHWFRAHHELRFNAMSQGSGCFTAGPANRSSFFTQDDVKEDSVQAAWKPTFLHVIELAKQNNVFWADTHDRPWLNQPAADDRNKKAPDAVALANDGHPAPDLVIAFHDNKASCGGKFSREDQGKLFVYCVLVQEYYQRTRPFLPCSLFDGRYAQCFKVVRSRNPALHPFYVDRSPVLDLSKHADAQLYAAFLMDRASSGFNLEKLHPCAGTVIGRGATSLVFTHKQHDDCVIKVAYASWDHSNERRILRELAGAGGMLRLHPDDDADDKACLLLTPKLERLERRRLVSLLGTLIDRDGHLRQLHARGFVHCDVRPPNVMKAPGEILRAALVDFGAVRHADEEDYFTHGTLAYASSRVLDAYEANTKIQVATVDDMVSFARCVIAVYHNVVDDERILSNNVDRIRVCWQEIEAISQFARRLLELCYHSPPNYDAVCSFLSQSIVGGVPEILR